MVKRFIFCSIYLILLYNKRDLFILQSNGVLTLLGMQKDKLVSILLLRNRYLNITSNL